MDFDETGTVQKDQLKFKKPQPLPALLVAHAPEKAVSKFHSAINGTLVVGRDSTADFTVRDMEISRNHFQIKKGLGGYKIKDLGSTNGTYVNGRKLKNAAGLPDKAVIRAGNALMVFHKDIRQMVFEAQNTYGISGRFHAPKLLRNLQTTANAGRSVLLAGPSGTGKELAAHAIAAMAKKKITIQNAARYSSEEEAKSTLFGVGKEVFTKVKEKSGYIEQADQGVFFLDETYMLPLTVQKSLLRVLEEQTVTRIGETKPIKVDVQFVFASNEPGPTYGFAEDLLNRIKVIAIPALKDRLADIPSIFDHLFAQAIRKEMAAPGPVLKKLTVAHYEALMLDGFERANVRGLLDVIESIIDQVNSGSKVEEAIHTTFSERFGTDSYTPSSSEEIGPGGSEPTKVPTPREDPGLAFEEIVEEAYNRLMGNVTAICKELRSRGYKTSRRSIAGIIDKSGYKRLKKPRK